MPHAIQQTYSSFYTHRKNSHKNTSASNLQKNENTPARTWKTLFLVSFSKKNSCSAVVYNLKSRSAIECAQTDPSVVYQRWEGTENVAPKP